MYELLIVVIKSNILSIVYVWEFFEYDLDLMKILGEMLEECWECLFENSKFFIVNFKKIESWFNVFMCIFVVYNKVFFLLFLKSIVLIEKFNVCMVSSNIKKKGINDFFEVVSLCSFNSNI